MNGDSNDSMDAQILSQEQWAIELLARETHTEISAVQEVFLVEYKKDLRSMRISSRTCPCSRATVSEEY